MSNNILHSCEDIACANMDMPLVKGKENILDATNAQDFQISKDKPNSLQNRGVQQETTEILSMEQSREMSLMEETERLRQEKSILEEELQDVNAEIMSVQEEAFTNEEVLLQRIQFLGQELESHEADSSETIAQLDCELRSVAVALERVTVERDNLSAALMDAAREKVSALVKVAELSGLLHHALKKFDPDEPGTEDDLAQNELLTRYQAVMEDKLSLQFRLQDTESKLASTQAELTAVTHDLDIEGEHSHLLSTLLEKREQECAQLTDQSDQQEQTIVELRSIIEEMEDSNQSREEDVHEMATHLRAMQDRLEELQHQATQQHESTADTETELREMFEERITLLQRQMDLIGELASSEFSMIGLSEELDASRQANDSLRTENGLLSHECERLLGEVRKFWLQQGGASDDQNLSLMLEGTGLNTNLKEDVPASELEEGEILSEPASPDTSCTVTCKAHQNLHVLAETENIPSN
eukprot:jgi/Ulvmu1/7262/UM035_0049.1